MLLQYELLDDSGPWWTVKSDLGEQGIVPSNYCEQIAGGPPVPGLPAAPPSYGAQPAAGYAPAAPAAGYAPQQGYAAPGQQQQTTVVQMGGGMQAPFMNPNGGQCQMVWAVINIISGVWPCGCVALCSAMGATGATNIAVYNSNMATAKMCNIAGTITLVIAIIIIIVVVVKVAKSGCYISAGPFGSVWVDDDGLC